MKSFLALTFALLSFSVIALTGCGSPENGLVTNQGDMTLEEYNKLVADAPTEDPGEETYEAEQ